MQLNASTDFAKQLEVGRVGESAVSRFMIDRGWQVLPAYEIEIHTGKGPRLFGRYGSLVAPDMLMFRMGKSVWCEVKTKSAFAWHRKTQSWTTGIDKRHWLNYVEVKRHTLFKIWILFLQMPGTAKDTPPFMTSPTGLFGNEIDVLCRRVAHDWPPNAGHGMIYWDIKSLTKIATLGEVTGRKDGSL